MFSYVYKFQMIKDVFAFFSFGDGFIRNSGTLWRVYNLDMEIEKSLLLEENDDDDGVVDVKIVCIVFYVFAKCGCAN